MPRFFVDKPAVDAGAITLSGGDARHLRVLRVKEGDKLDVCDGEGGYYRCAVKSIGRERATLAILDETAFESEPSLKITLFQGLPKNDKMELIIQKCVELGVYDIVPVQTERSVARINDKSGRKADRWHNIAEAAAKQCGRGFVPEVSEPVTFKSAVERAVELKTAFMAYENERDFGIAQFFASCPAMDAVGVFIGPEGGFTDAETALCVERGIRTVSLGGRVYRTETAGFVAVISLLLLKGEL
jgi:16S rRNA (uracil1498-N3)-methyltransferase